MPCLAIIASGLLVATGILETEATSSRFLQRAMEWEPHGTEPDKTEPHAAAPNATSANGTEQDGMAPPAGVKLPKGAVLEVLKKTAPSQQETEECLCSMGKFWHWRLRSCVEQGDWGYECGFFPREHWDRVCKDGLTCRATKTQDNYQSHGMFEGTSGARPASCVKCTKDDNCKAGKERHQTECMKEVSLKGEACVSVRLHMPEQEKEINKTLTHTARATATATATATAKATAPVKHDEKAEKHDVFMQIREPEVDDSMPHNEGTADSEGNDTHHKEAEEDAAEAVAKATGTAQAEATHTATKTVKTIKRIPAFDTEATHCVSVEEGAKLLDLQDVKGISTVLSDEIIATMQKKAFSVATAKALENAKSEAANGEEDTSVTEEAERRVKEESEAQASKAATEAAEAAAKKRARDAAQAAAEDLAKRKAQADEANGAATKVTPAPAKPENEAKPAEKAKPKPEAEPPSTIPEDEVETTSTTPAVEGREEAVAEIVGGGMKGEPLVERIDPTEPPVLRKVPEGFAEP